MDFATKKQTPLLDPRYSHQARNIIAAQGWDGRGGIGAHMQGVEEPVGAKEKLKKPRRPLVGVATSEEHSDDWGPEVYGYPVKVFGQERIQLVEFSYKGHPIPTNESKRCDHSRARPLRYWKGVLGIAENIYPHPKGITFKEVVTATPLSKLTVKLLTRAFIEYATAPPRAQAMWEKRLGESDLPWHLVWGISRHPALTPKDRKASLRILHRRVKMRTWEDASAPCRLCGKGKDTLSHLADCETIKSLFSTLLLSKEDPPGPKLIYLGLHKDNTPLVGWSAVLHALTWKFILIAFTRLDTCGEQPDTYKIAQSVLYRSAVRLEAYAYRVKAQYMHAASQLQRNVRQQPTRAGPIDFVSGGLLSENPRESAKEARNARWRKAPARPLMSETLRKPKITHLKWKRRSCAAVAPIARFDDKSNLIFECNWYEVYRGQMSMYMDTPHVQLPDRKPKRAREQTLMRYEEMQGVNKLEWLGEEESRFKRIRAECEKIARDTRRKLIHPI